MAAHTEYELIALHATSVVEGEGVLVEKAGFAGLVEHAYLRGFELSAQLLLVVDHFYDVLGAVQQPNEIYLGRHTFEAVVGEVLRVAHQARRPGQHAGRDAAIVRTDAAHLCALDEHHFCTQFAGAQSRRYPGRSAADHDHLRHLLPPFREVLTISSTLA